VFGAIARDDFLRGMDHDTVADRLAYHWGETTALHPFRDGNTRTQRLYFHQLTTEAGWSSTGTASTPAWTSSSRHD